MPVETSDVAVRPKTQSNGVNGIAAVQPETELPPFPVECLAPVEQAMVEAVCAVYGEQFRDLAAMSAIGVVSAALGKGLAARFPRDRTKKTFGNLFVMPVVESGGGKGIAFSAMAEPLMTRAGEIESEWAKGKGPETATRIRVLEKRRDTFISSLAKEGDTGTEADILNQDITLIEDELSELRGMHCPVLYHDDMTEAAMAQYIYQQGEQGALLSEDAAYVVQNVLGRFNATGDTDDSILCQGFSGKPYRPYRKTTNAPMLNEPVISFLLYVQPCRFEQLLKKKMLQESGFLPRVMPAMLDLPAQLGGGVLDESVAAQYSAMVNMLVDAYRLASANAQAVVDEDHDAFREIIAYYEECYAQANGEFKDVKPFAVRWPEWAWKLAVGRHAAQYGEFAREKKISLDTTKRAIQLARWFKAHQLDLLTRGRVSERVENEDKLIGQAQAWTQEHGDGHLFTRNQVRQYLHVSKDLAQDMCERLVTRGVLKTTGLVKTGGRPTVKYSLAKPGK